jgi:hypothetical protein
MAFGSFASSRSAGEVGDADRVEVLGDVSEDTVLRATARGFGFSGLTICFGASTTTPGSEAVAPNEGVAVCDNKATARLAANSDEAFMAMSSQSWEGAFHPIPMRRVTQVQLPEIQIRPPGGQTGQYPTSGAVLGQCPTNHKNKIGTFRISVL